MKGELMHLLFYPQQAALSARSADLMSQAVIRRMHKRARTKTRIHSGSVGALAAELAKPSLTIFLTFKPINIRNR